MPDHHATEEILHASGTPGTALRGGFYADTAVMLLGNAAETGELAAPEDGPVNWTTHDDTSEGIAAALVDPDIDEQTLELTGSETVDLAGIAEIASELSGRPIRRIVVPDDEFRDGMIARGVPPERADMMLGIFQASRQGGFTRLAPPSAVSRAAVRLAWWLLTARGNRGWRSGPGPVVRRGRRCPRRRGTRPRSPR